MRPVRCPVTRSGNAGIKKWIDNQMHGRSCVVVLAGAATAARKMDQLRDPEGTKKVGRALSESTSTSA